MYSAWINFMVEDVLDEEEHEALQNQEEEEQNELLMEYPADEEDEAEEEEEEQILPLFSEGEPHLKPIHEGSSITLMVLVLLYIR